MGKSLVIKGIDASMVGLGKVYFSDTPVEPDVPVEPDLNTIEAVADRQGCYLTYEAGQVRATNVAGYGYKYYDMTGFRGKTIRVATLQSKGDFGYGCSCALLRNASVTTAVTGILGNSSEDIYAAISPSTSLANEEIDLYISESVTYLLVGYAVTNQFDSASVKVKVIDDMVALLGSVGIPNTTPYYYMTVNNGAVSNQRLGNAAFNVLYVPNIGALYGRSKLRITSCQTLGDVSDGAIVAITKTAINVGVGGQIAPANDVLFVRQPINSNIPESIELEIPDDAFYLIIGCRTNEDFSVEDVKVEIIDEFSPVQQEWIDIPQGKSSPRTNLFLRYNNEAVKADSVSNSSFGYRFAEVSNYVGKTIRITTSQSLGDANNGCLFAVGKNAKNITTESGGNLLEASDVLYSKKPSVSNEVETVEFVVPAGSTYLFVGYHEVEGFVSSDVKIQVLT